MALSALKARSTISLMHRNEHQERLAWDDERSALTRFGAHSEFVALPEAAASIRNGLNQEPRKAGESDSRPFLASWLPHHALGCSIRVHLKARNRTLGRASAGNGRSKPNLSSPRGEGVGALAPNHDRPAFPDRFRFQCRSLTRRCEPSQRPDLDATSFNHVGTRLGVLDCLVKARRLND